MEFDRARNEEQRHIRLEQIKTAAIQLFDTEPFHDITLAKIADKTSFTRGNLYKYIISKEEIYLLVTMDEMVLWIHDLEETLRAETTASIDDFSHKWATVMYRHQRLLKLITLLFTILEKNVPFERLVSFKKDYARATVNLFQILKTTFHTWDDKVVKKFIRMQMQYATGLYPSTSLSPIQEEAIKQSGVPHEQIDFVTEFSEFVGYTIRYLNEQAV